MVLGYNLLICLQMRLLVLRCMHLPRRFVYSYLGGLAAFVFVFNPQMLTFTLASGVANRLNLLWIPLLSH